MVVRFSEEEKEKKKKIFFFCFPRYNFFKWKNLELFQFPGPLTIAHKSVKVLVSHHVDSSRPHELQPARVLRPWNSPGKNTGVGSHSFLQGIFPTQASNPGLPHCKQILYHLTHQDSPQEYLKHSQDCVVPTKICFSHLFQHVQVSLLSGPFHSLLPNKRKS